MSKRKKKVKLVKRQTLGAKRDKQGFLLTARSAEVIPRYVVYAIAMAFLCFVIGSVRFGMAPLPDGYANFQSAMTFASGDGLVVEPDGPGPNNFFIALLAGVAKKIASANPLILTSIFNYAAFLYILLALGKRAYREEDDIPDIAERFSGFWLVAAHPAIWIFVNSGMDTILFAAFMTAGFLLLVDHLEYETPSWRSGLALGLAAMARPEAVFFVAGALVLTLVFGKPKTKLKDAAIGAGAAILLFAPFAALRLSMGGAMFDGAFDAFGRFGPGAGYTLVWLITNIIATATVVIALYHAFKDSPIRIRSIIGLVWLLGFVLLATLMGGDGAPYGRLYIPAIPVIAWMMADQWPLIAQWLHERGTATRNVTRYASLGIIVVSLIWPIFYPTHFQTYQSWLEQSKEHRAIGLQLGKLTAGVRTTVSNLPSPVMQYHSGLSKSDDPAMYYVASFPKDIENRELFYEIIGVTKDLRATNDISDRYTLMTLNDDERTVVFLVEKDATKSVRGAFKPLDLFKPKLKSDLDS